MQGFHTLMGRWSGPGMATCALLACMAAQAGDVVPYEAQMFDRLGAQGLPVIVDVVAPWCPTCKAQKPAIEALAAQPDYRDVTVLYLDFDADKAALERFRVHLQSTLIGFRGGREVGRSVGETRPQAIEALFQSTLR